MAMLGGKQGTRDALDALSQYEQAMFQKGLEMKRQELMGQAQTAEERIKSTTPDQRARGAIDGITKNLLDEAAQKGKDVTEDKARKVATDTAHRVESKK
jgi:hypothetical protein